MFHVKPDESGSAKRIGAGLYPKSVPPWFWPRTELWPERSHQPRAHQEGLPLRRPGRCTRKIVELCLKGTRRRLAGWQLMENDFEYFWLHGLCRPTVRSIRNWRSESGFVSELAGLSPLTTRMRRNGFACPRV